LTRSQHSAKEADVAKKQTLSNTRTLTLRAASAYIGLALAVIAITGTFMAGAVGLTKVFSVYLPEISLTILVVTAVLAFLAMLATVTAILDALGLANDKYALGMPEGSIRAVIALSLLLIFVIASLYLYSSLEPSNWAQGLEKEQFEAFLEKNPERVLDFASYERGGKTLYNVRLKTERNQASVQYANQMLTLVGTLVGAVSGFYFGTRSVAVARGMGAPSQPVIGRIDPDKLEAKDGVTVKISGKNFDLPKEGATVKLIREGEDPVMGQDVTSSTTKIQCTFSLKDKKEGEWNLVVVNEDGEEAKEPVQIVAPAPPAAPPLPTVDKISPETGEAAKGKITVTVTGENFATNAQVTLKREGQADVVATIEGDITPTQITCTFDLTGKAVGKWDVVVVNPDTKQEGKKPAAFEVK
jgi:hypothetical protein